MIRENFSSINKVVKGDLILGCNFETHLPKTSEAVGAKFFIWLHLSLYKTERSANLVYLVSVKKFDPRALLI